jgi:hypothetical protein
LPPASNRAFLQRYAEPDAISNAIGYAMHRSRSHDAVIRVYDEAGNVIDTHEHKGDFKEWSQKGGDSCRICLTESVMDEQHRI